ncbi:MAG: pyruvate, phosphate dikinase, partial [Armatimonadota bacterium]|nr:pyruvate, phosphate dikinase [Armatimonadota bacterium]
MSTDGKSAQKRVWLFREGNKSLKDLLGGKGANLAEMTNIGMPVPPGFTITTEVCNEYYRNGRKLPASLMDEVKVALADVENAIGKRFGDPKNPLLFSVRSGAKFSMPGMMDTVLNLGLNDETLQGLIEATGDPRFAYDSYRRFLMMFSDITLKADYPGLSKEGFERLLTQHKNQLGKNLDTELTAGDWQALCDIYKKFFTEQTGGKQFPTDPMEQLETAITAVFRSWNNERAIVYRNKEKIDHNIGTAVNVQAMVFGNMGDDCGTGVMFTRNAANGENVIYGEYLMNAQGEDVVAGVRTPMEIARLEESNKEIYDQLISMTKQLERHYHDMQDIEFTIEKGKLYILQCRSGKRTGTAALKIAVDMVNEGLINQQEAVLRVPPEGLEQALHPRLIGTAKAKRIAKGLNAGPGGAVGKAIFSSEKAAELGKGGKGEPVILVSAETTPDDIKGMLAAQGVLTARGGRTSHAALVARQFGIPTICGCSELKMDGHHATSFTAGGVTINEGDWITIDGTEGIVYGGRLEVESAGLTEDFTTLMKWADEARKLGVRANADTPEQAEEAVRLGAEGIGLCRTEHMFLEEERLPIVRDMILAEDEAARQAALDRLRPIQQEDFVGIFRAMNGKPVTVRLIDPPLHEFLPNHTELAVEIATAKAKGETSGLAEKEALLKKVNELHEQNPMLGLRGCRLSIVFPGIVEMQVGAIIGAAAQVKKEGVDVHPEIMIPLVGHINELTWVKQRLEAVAQKTQQEAGEVDYMFGTMIEVPRAALTSEEIAREAQFFSFGTNDLTQMTFGMSRDDAGPFLQAYIREEIYKEDPTVSIDQTGVGRLMQICVEDARKSRPDIKLGICGEHGGDPDSVKF